MSEGNKVCPFLAGASMVSSAIHGGIDTAQVLNEFQKTIEYGREFPVVREGVNCFRGECALWDSLKNRCALGRYQYEK